MYIMNTVVNSIFENVYISYYPWYLKAIGEQYLGGNLIANMYPRWTRADYNSEIKREKSIKKKARPSTGHFR